MIDTKSSLIRISNNYSHPASCDVTNQKIKIQSSLIWPTLAFALALFAGLSEVGGKVSFRHINTNNNNNKQQQIAITCKESRGRPRRQGVREQVSFDLEIVSMRLKDHHSRIFVNIVFVIETLEA
jgi:hypothetical protein